jgi:hypothetical protein
MAIEYKANKLFDFSSKEERGFEYKFLRYDVYLKIRVKIRDLSF